MENKIFGGMMVIKEVLSAMSRAEKSKEEEQRIRQIMNEVMKESSTNMAERDMMNRMVQLMEHNTRQTVELHAAARERDYYRTQMEDLNRNMDRLCKDKGPSSSGDEGGLTPKQKKLAQMLDELKDMRKDRKGQKNQGKQFQGGGGAAAGGGAGPRGGGGPRGGAGPRGGGGPRGGAGPRDGAGPRGGGGPRDGGGARQRARSRPRDGNLPWTDDLKLPHHEKKQQNQDQGGFGKFDRQNKDGAPFAQGNPFNQNFRKESDQFVNPFNQNYRKESDQFVNPFNQNYRKESDQFVMVGPQDCKPDGSPCKPFQYDNQYQKAPFQNRFHQNNNNFPKNQNFGNKGDFDSRGDGQDHRGFQFNNVQRHRDYGAQFFNRDGAQSAGMQEQGASGNSFQHRGQFQHDRGQHHGRFQYNHRQFQSRGKQNNPLEGFNISQLSAEEVNAVKEMLKQQQQQQQKKPEEVVKNAEVKVNPNKTAFKKKKKPRKPKSEKNKTAVASPNTAAAGEDVVADVDVEDSTDDDSSDDSEDCDTKVTKNPDPVTAVASVDDTSPIGSGLKKKKGEDKGQTDVAAGVEKPKDSNPFTVFLASGLDLNSGVNLDDKVKDMVLIAKGGDGNLITFQPGTVRELVEFKRKYPNAEAIIVQPSEKK